MSFHATNYTVSVVLLMALTLFIAGVRMRKPLESNWPLLYWVLMTFLIFRYPDDAVDPRFVLVGLAAGLLLRFEFMGSIVANLLKVVELFVWGYILYKGLIIAFMR
jgi:hypothetical protein